MFSPRQNRNMLQAAGHTLGLVYHQTVYNLRNDHRNAVVGLLLTISQTLIFMGAFLALFLILGVRASPLRGDFILYLMSGIFIFMTHVRTVGAVSSSGGIGGLARHKPLNPAVLIAAAALATLYRQMISVLAILWIYHVLINPVEIENPAGALAMLLLAWFSGCCIGVIFMALKPWMPKSAQMMSMIYQRVNMFASGKMFVANTLPAMLLPWFVWNPLFHIIDQMRGFIFINYTPQRTDPLYALWFSLAALMVGLLISFSTRKYESLSWGAAS